MNMESHEPTVFVVFGHARWTRGDDRGERVAVLVQAADDDSAIRATLETLSDQGYATAELERVGIVEAMPDDEPFASAYEGALRGETAIIRF